MSERPMTVTTSREPTQQERAAASRLVLRHARNRHDLRTLLDMLGLGRREDQ